MDNLPELPVYTFAPNTGGILSLILTIVLPLLVAIITTRVTSAGTKGILLLVIVVIKTTVEAVISNNNDYINFAWTPFLMNMIINFTIAAIMHFGIWKPIGASKALQDNVGPTAKVIDGESYPR